MSRDEAIEILYDMRDEYNLFGDEEEATRYHVLSWAIQEMKSIPMGRRKGHWIKHKDGYYKCSECGSRGSAIKAHYCHHCGARMDEVKR